MTPGMLAALRHFVQRLILITANEGMNVRDVRVVYSHQLVLVRYKQNFPRMYLLLQSASAGSVV